MHSRKQTGFKGEDKTERAQKIRQDRRNLGNAKLHSRSSKQAEESSENWTDPGGRNQERCGYMYVPIHGGETILQGQERAIDFRSSGGGGKLTRGRKPARGSGQCSPGRVAEVLLRWCLAADDEQRAARSLCPEVESGSYRLRSRFAEDSKTATAVQPPPVQEGFGDEDERRGCGCVWLWRRRMMRGHGDRECFNF